MARPQSAAKLGFFPFPADCLPLLLEHLEPPEVPQRCFLLDPCAGEGDAITAIAAGLHVPPANVHAIELSTSRGNTLRDKHPAFQTLGPANFHATEISFNAFSLVYVNPPYDDEIGGGRREELSFAVRALNVLIPGGVFVMVLPESRLFAYGQGPTGMRATLSCRLTDLAAYALPEAHRRYHETVVLGVKRKTPVPAAEAGGFHEGRWWDHIASQGVLGRPRRTYKVPAGKAPGNWRKTGFAPEELEQAMARSPLGARLTPAAEAAARPSPPLPPGRGHVALILAAGDLDGLVWPEGEPPHVVRGTAKKISFRDESKCEERRCDDGSTVVKEVTSERITLTIRAVGVDGAIHTFSDQPEK
jgi:hypothetical protein